jgi:hypothetical protein
MRSVSIAAAGIAIFCLIGPAIAANPPYPPDYQHFPLLNDYNNLRNAKFVWLRDIRDAKEKVRKAIVTGVKKGQKLTPDAQEQVDRLDGEIKALDGEIDLIQGPPKNPKERAAQRALVKANVEAWVNALNRAAIAAAKFDDKEHRAEATKLARESADLQKDLEGAKL